jgi:hypothetical protein
MVYRWGCQRFSRYIRTFSLRFKGDRTIPYGHDQHTILNTPRHKEQDYTWFMGGDLNGFQYIKVVLQNQSKITIDYRIESVAYNQLYN